MAVSTLSMRVIIKKRRGFWVAFAVLRFLVILGVDSGRLAPILSRFTRIEPEPCQR